MSNQEQLATSSVLGFSILCEEILFHAFEYSKRLILQFLIVYDKQDYFGDYTIITKSLEEMLSLFKISILARVNMAEFVIFAGSITQFEKEKKMNLFLDFKFSGLSLFSNVTSITLLDCILCLLNRPKFCKHSHKIGCQYNYKPHTLKPNLQKLNLLHWRQTENEGLIYSKKANYKYVNDQWKT